jgi:hypothetical protein
MVGAPLGDDVAFDYEPGEIPAHLALLVAQPRRGVGMQVGLAIRRPELPGVLAVKANPLLEVEVQPDCLAHALPVLLSDQAALDPDVRRQTRHINHYTPYWFRLHRTTTS